MTTTNALLHTIVSEVDTLISWAHADKENSLESDAPEQAKEDEERAKKLTQARNLLVSSFKLM